MQCFVALLNVGSGFKGHPKVCMDWQPLRQVRCILMVS